MLAINFQNAIERPDVTNFTCMLIRLLMKADPANMCKLYTIYPMEVAMVFAYKTNAPTDGSGQVRYDQLELMADHLVVIEGFMKGETNADDS